MLIYRIYNLAVDMSQPIISYKNILGKSRKHGERKCTDVSTGTSGCPN